MTNEKKTKFKTKEEALTYLNKNPGLYNQNDEITIDLNYINGNRYVHAAQNPDGEDKYIVQKVKNNIIELELVEKKYYNGGAKRRSHAKSKKTTKSKKALKKVKSKSKKNIKKRSSKRVKRSRTHKRK